MTFKISWAIAVALFTIINLTALAANWQSQHALKWLEKIIAI
jgi:hypothetical protein